MRTLICAVVVTAFGFAASESALADAEAGQGYFTGSATYVDDDKRRGLEDGINGGKLGIGYALNDRWNVEGFVSFAYPDSTLLPLPDPDEEHRGIGFDLQRVFRRSERFSPFITGGVGHFQTSIAGVKAEGGMAQIGAGFYLDLFSSNIALRGEVNRRRENATTNQRIDNLVSLGIHIPFGAATPRWTDSDGDGVGDGTDQCPNTPAGVAVDATGCERDSDGDGVVDSRDQCPGTPRGVPVDANGCPMDSDGDGVSDDQDACPGTVAGAEVDEKGCEKDDDGDGVVNRLDECPGTPAGAQVDIKGCEIKEEIRLEGVNFESNSDRLLDSAFGILNDAAATLEKNPSIKVEVAGHTDSDGTAEYNEGLSARRAQTVHDYLASRGVDVARMSVRGYGESQPIADNSTAAGKAQNRRVVLRIVER